MALLPVQPVGVPVHCTAKTWARFTAKVVVPPGCRFWVGALADDGYRRFTADGRTVRASQFLWPGSTAQCHPGWWVMHQSCDEPSCARLDHRRAGEPDQEPGQRRRREPLGGVAATGRADRRADGRCGPGPSGPP